MAWSPASKEEVEVRVADELPACEPDLALWFDQIRVEAFAAPIARRGIIESVIVIARVAGYVVYFEDVEEGFNFAPFGASGTIDQPDYEQWALQHVLWQLRDHLHRTRPGTPP